MIAWLCKFTELWLYSSNLISWANQVQELSRHQVEQRWLIPQGIWAFETLWMFLALLSFIGCEHRNRAEKVTWRGSVPPYVPSSLWFLLCDCNHGHSDGCSKGLGELSLLEGNSLPVLDVEWLVCSSPAYSYARHPNMEDDFIHS